MRDLGLNVNWSYEALEEIEELSSRDVAIIGIGVRLPEAADTEQFWTMLREGVNCVGDFPPNRRKDVESYLDFINGKKGENKFAPGAYLESIDQFDHEFFRISSREAQLMDPNQRVFLECAWSTIEDAGYGGDQLNGSKTGVYVGYTARNEYQSYISQVEPESVVIAEAGNLHSIIASRIAYILDFHGPSMLVDTACSSSLVAVHLACQGLRNGECDMALAGGVKLSLFPVNHREKLDIESAGQEVRTFDNHSDGTCFGEGSISMLLKPLDRALKDKDSIYAVIKGSAVNQDGASVGITAPNVLAQKELLISAWQDAGIDPQTLGYIEAHGTATKLGDPVEVSAIQKAFAQFTGRKQFCGIGSVKTNLGHLDQAAGMAGLLKAVMSLKHKQLPPSLHFREPNRKIAFEDSPVYVNDKLSDWEGGDTPRRCGVSSFGLSGTNCHVVLEEAPSGESGKAPKSYPAVLVLSARKKGECRRLLRSFRQHLLLDENVQVGDLCYTASVGRGHYYARVAIIANDKADLMEKLEQLDSGGLDNPRGNEIFVGEHKVVPEMKAHLESHELRESECNRLTAQAEELIDGILVRQGDCSRVMLDQICLLYVRGANIDWERLYSGKGHQRLNLPSYPFEKKRCWLNIPPTTRSEFDTLPTYGGERLTHPLLDYCAVESISQDVYITCFDPDKHWVLSEHKIMGECLVPGTVYLEIARECGSRYFGNSKLDLQDVFFISPLFVRFGEMQEVQTIIVKGKDCLEFTIASRNTTETDSKKTWIRYCEGKIFAHGAEPKRTSSLAAILEHCPRRIEKGDGVATGGHFSFGPRWTSLVCDMHAGDQQVLTELQLPERFLTDLQQFYLHPSLLDIAVNAVTQTTGHGMYLPLSYKSFKIFRAIPARVYSYIKKVSDNQESLETISFDITLLDPDGRVICDIKEFTIKRVHEGGLKLTPAVSDDHLHQLKYIAQPLTVQRQPPQGKVLVLASGHPLCSGLIQSLKQQGHEVVVAVEGDGSHREVPWDYTVDNTEKGFRDLFGKLPINDITRIVHMLSLGPEGQAETYAGLEKCQQSGVYSLLHLFQAAAPGAVRPVDLVIVAENVYGTSKEQQKIHPEQAPLLGLGKVMNTESTQIKCRCIDMDHTADTASLAIEVENNAGGNYYTAYRKGIRYIEMLDQINTRESETPVVFSKEGVYVITGGLGGLGIEAAKCIAEEGPVNLALIGRSALPQHPDWKALAGKFNGRMDERIRNIIDIEASGSAVVYFRADVSDASELSQALDEARHRFGRVRGIVHAAGVAGGGFLVGRQREKFSEVLAPKVYGTWLLDILSRNDEPDFFVNFSSISSLYGDSGQGDYTAANSYLDSFGTYRSKLGLRTITVNWSAWKETGMAEELGVQDQGVFQMLSTHTAVSLFRQVLKMNADRIIAGKLDLDRLASLDNRLPLQLADTLRMKLERKAKPSVSMEESYPERVFRLKGRGDEGYSQAEKGLARIWANILDAVEIDIYESFEDLGGDSILATRLYKEIEKTYQGAIDISHIFAYPSIYEMACFIEQRIRTADEIEPAETLPDRLDDILDHLEQGYITIEEAELAIRNVR